ncbi:NAD(P)/FAD-dependent oxidoreductase [Methanobrevibacter sp. DSM 116169]|uniref:NAD(P)/FAD-dependent oxidoreductase n=1 Tax=Methanobrevibacter sp. DSM 116169 TaxID=3242727 RepID=UPI0038FC2BEA
MKEFKVAIIGGGPAGMIAAIAASKNSDSVILLEKTDSLGKKLLLTGGGRCNITNGSSIKEHLKLSNNFLKHSFYSFSNDDLLDFFKSKGIDFQEESYKNVFPKNKNAQDILNVLENTLNNLNVDIELSFKVGKIIKKNDYFIINDTIKARNIIIATGGITYPSTGSSGDGYKIVKTFNHDISEIKYGLVPLVSKNLYLTALSGTPLDNILVKYKKSSSSKTVLISHFGLTGPGILDLSSEISKNLTYDILNYETKFPDNLNISIDFQPKINRDELNNKIINEIPLNGKTKIKNYLKTYLSNKLIDFFLNEINVNGDNTLSNISKKDKNKIIENLKGFNIKIDGLYKDLSKVTIGGIPTNEINPKTMESKIVKNLYFAGEILEPASISGGYNLQIAFSTGHLAGSVINEKN